MRLKMELSTSPNLFTGRGCWGHILKALLVYAGIKDGCNHTYDRRERPIALPSLPSGNGRFDGLMPDGIVLPNLILREAGVAAHLLLFFLRLRFAGDQNDALVGEVRFDVLQNFLAVHRP